MKSSKPLRGFTGSRRYTLPGALPLPHPVTAALAAGRLTHALCLEAPSPALLRDTAISLAGALLCRKGGAAMCGDCPACRKVLVGEHPDLMLYDPEENKDIYKKDSVRDLRADLYRTPVEAARKVAILQLAERLPAEGQNLLLKIIEEPPADTFFIFTVQNRYRLLPTVLSRVTCYALPPAGAEDCLRRMRELAPGHTEEELNCALLRCGGIPETGAALLKDPAIQKRYAAAEEMLAGLAMGNGYRILAAAAPMERDRAGYTALLETLGEHLDANPDIHLVCIDTLSKIKPKAKPFENAYDADYDYMGRLKAFADSRGICVLLVHHTRKSKNPEDSFDNINGSTGILGAADFTIVLDKQSRMDDEAGFLLTGRDIEQCERVIRFDKARCRWVMQGTAAQLAAQRRVAEYEAEPIVKTLRVLLQQGDGTWSGYSKNLMEMGQRYAHTELAPTSQALAKRITELEPMLWERDAVKHWMQDNGSSAKRHCFRQQRIDNTVADSSSAQLSLRHKYC